MHEHGTRNLGRMMLLLAVVPLGCQEAPSPPEFTLADNALSTKFDPRATGSVRAQVHWEGDVPAVPALRAYANRTYAIANQFVGEKPNPNAPRIDVASGGVGQAVVYLEKVDLERARPWDHAGVRVVVHNRELCVRQGDALSAIGFVRRGAEVEFVNDDVNYHLLRGRGAAFFSLPLVIAHEPAHRRLDRPGIVELTAGAGQFWIQGYLLVTEHPYYGLTDADGRFELTQVPEGDYDLVVWQPNWHIERQERDPEVGLVSRIFFAAPLEQRQRIRVERGGAVDARFTCSTAKFR